MIPYPTATVRHSSGNGRIGIIDNGTRRSHSSIRSRGYILRMKSRKGDNVGSQRATVGDPTITVLEGDRIKTEAESLTTSASAGEPLVVEVTQREFTKPLVSRAHQNSALTFAMIKSRHQRAANLRWNFVLFGTFLFHHWRTCDERDHLSGRACRGHWSDSFILRLTLECLPWKIETLPTEAMR